MVCQCRFRAPEGLRFEAERPQHAFEYQAPALIVFDENHDPTVPVDDVATICRGDAHPPIVRAAHYARIVPAGRRRRPLGHAAMGQTAWCAACSGSQVQTAGVTVRASGDQLVQLRRNPPEFGRVGRAHLGHHARASKGFAST
jgi:hypothetical protein